MDVRMAVGKATANMLGIQRQTNTSTRIKITSYNQCKHEKISICGLSEKVALNMKTRYR